MELERRRSTRINDEETRKRLTRENINLSYGNCFLGPYLEKRTIDRDDLGQAGFFGTWDATESFDESISERFSTHGGYHIKRHIKLEVKKVFEKGFHLPKYVYEQRRRILQYQGEFIDQHNHSPSYQELADDFNQKWPREVLKKNKGRDPTEKEVEDFWKKKTKLTADKIMGFFAVYQCRRYNKTPFEQNPKGNIIEREDTSHHNRAPLTQVIEQEQFTRLRESLEKLPENERELVERRFGYNGYSPHTFKELGNVLGIPRSRISKKLLPQILKKLQIAIEGEK
jgi:RNA polymerase nonessential primary-like sigma factor